MNGYIGTYTGKQFYPLEPKAEDICIKDIAHSLSQICRFNGHTKKFCSVAQHSLNVERVLRHHCKTTRLYGLMHDFAEAYIGDMTTPYKVTFGHLVTDTEKEIMNKVYERFGVEPPSKLMNRIIKSADEYTLSLEAKKYMRNSNLWNIAQVKGRLPIRLPRKVTEWLLIYRFNKLRRAYEFD